MTIKVTQSELLPRGSQTGLVTFMSWQRLAENLRLSGEVKPNEKIVGLEVSADGLKLVFEKVR